MVSIEFTDKAKENLERLETEVQQRVAKKFEEIQNKTRELGVDPDRYVKKLQGYNYHVLRIGDYRAIIKWEKDSDIFIIVAIGHRSTIYDRGIS